MTDKKRLISLIPFYLNGTLRGSELLEVEYFVNNDPEGKLALEEWHKVSTLVREQEDHCPPRDAESKLFSRIRSQSMEQLEIFHPYALVLSMVMLVLLWLTIRPGVELNWTIHNSNVTSFKVYRSSVEGSNYRLLDEIPVEKSDGDYSYIDIFYWPFEQYIYYIEGMRSQDSLGVSQVVADNSWLALPGQLVIICASLTIGYGVIMLIRNRKVFRNQTQGQIPGKL